LQWFFVCRSFFLFVAVQLVVPTVTALIVSTQLSEKQQLSNSMSYVIEKHNFYINECFVTDGESALLSGTIRGMHNVLMHAS